jgi:pyruvate kinase
MRRLRRCKIVATLGPVSTPDEMLSKLFAAGVDVFRINMSHTSHEELRARVFALREVAKRFRRPVAILVDLQGPKLRIGTFRDTSVKLAPGDRIVLDDNPNPGDETRVYLPHPEILAALKPTDTVLIDDGRVRLHVVECTERNALCEVEIAGTISNRKGVSLPDTEIAVSAMTPKDHADLLAALEIGVDWIAASFVQRPEDVAEIKEIVDGRALVMSKIEKPQALGKLDEIIALSDGLMVARGDLGVEMPLEKVPGIQK